MRCESKAQVTAVRVPAMLALRSAVNFSTALSVCSSSFLNGSNAAASSLLSNAIAAEFTTTAWPQIREMMIGRWRKQSTPNSKPKPSDGKEPARDEWDDKLDDELKKLDDE